MIYIAVQLIQILSAHPRVHPATGHGGTRGPRGPKKNLINDEKKNLINDDALLKLVQNLKSVE